MMNDQINIYHIVHISKLTSIINDQYLLSDVEMQQHSTAGVTIGMPKIKLRRLTLQLSSCPGLSVGSCVPFYFCPRSPMLYMFSRANHPEIEYRGGQEPIVHLVANLYKTIAWANENRLQWAFTSSNAGSNYFEDFTNLADLDKLDWDAIHATQWNGKQDRKQAEFLIERCFPWDLIDEIGVYSYIQYSEVRRILSNALNQPKTSIQRSWYY